MKRWKCVCAYDGTSFTGWQSQPNRKSVQDAIEDALAKILKSKIRIHGSGRTDAGVHAMAQVFHFDSDWKHGGNKLTAALISQLPPSIRIQSTQSVNKQFHARYFAVAKRYHYRLFIGQADPFETRYCLSIPSRLDVPAIQAAGESLHGRHDFSAFSAENGADPERENPVKDFRSFLLTGRGRRLRFTFEASGFLYKMVRSITGALLLVGQGKLDPEEFRFILDSRSRTKDVVTAGPRGLFLEKVYYS